MKWRFIGPFVQQTATYATKCEQPKITQFTMRSMRNGAYFCSMDAFAIHRRQIAFGAKKVNCCMCWLQSREYTAFQSGRVRRVTATYLKYPGVSRLSLHPSCKQSLFVYLIASRICHKVINIVVCSLLFFFFLLLFGPLFCSRKCVVLFICAKQNHLLSIQFHCVVRSVRNFFEKRLFRIKT